MTQKLSGLEKKKLKAERWAKAQALHPDNLVACKAEFHRLFLEYMRECNRNAKIRAAREKEECDN